MNRQEESDRVLSADWRIHFPAKLAQSQDLQKRMISTLLEVLPPQALVLIPDLIAVGCSPLVETDENASPALWVNYQQSPALLAHEEHCNYRALLMRTWWQLTGITELVLVGCDGSWLATFNPAPNGKYVMYALGGA